jgi:hypothetical protein
MTAENHPAHLRQRDGESRDEWINRTNRSCYWCDHEPFANATEACDHEDICEDNPARRRRKFGSKVQES